MPIQQAIGVQAVTRRGQKRVPPYLCRWVQAVCISGCKCDKVLCESAPSEEGAHQASARRGRHGRQPKNWKCPVGWRGGAAQWGKQGRPTQELAGNVPRTAGRRNFFNLDFDGDVSELRRRRSLLPVLRVGGRTYAFYWLIGYGSSLLFLCCTISFARHSVLLSTVFLHIALTVL